MKFGLDDDTIQKINSVFRKFPEIEQVLIYGSRAKGNFREGSDIDLTLVGEKIPDEIQSRLFWEIDDLNTPYLFDISILKNLRSTPLEDHIQRVGQIFFKKDI